MIINSYTYNLPYAEDAKIWLKMDPGFRDYQSGTLKVQNWYNAADYSDVYTNSNVNRRPTDDGVKYNFDGGDWLESGNNHTFDTSATGWCMVARYTATDFNVSDAIIGNDDSNDTFIRHTSPDQLSVKAHNGSSASTKGIGTDSSLTNGQIYNVIISCTTGGNLNMFIDGTKQASSPSFPNDGYDLILDQAGGKNGNALVLTGSMQELVMFNRYLTDQECIDVNAYLANKF